MSESTAAPEIMTAVSFAAPVNTSIEGGGSSGPPLEISSPLEISAGIIFQAAPREGSVTIGPIPKIGSTIDFLGGATEPQSFSPIQPNPAKEFIPDELSDPIRNQTNVSLNPREIAHAVEDFFSPVDEPLPESGILPTPEEAVLAVNSLLRDKLGKDKGLKQQTLGAKTFSDYAKNIKEPISFTKHVVETVQNEIITPEVAEFKAIETALTEETIAQSPEITVAVKTLLVDAPHARATIQALLEIGIKEAPEIVGKALTK